MDIFKDFIYELRKLSFVDPYLKIHGDVTPKLKQHVRLLDVVKFVDGSYHTYYGEIKKIVNSFISCWTKTMDEALKVADKYDNEISKDGLLEIMEVTINMHRTKQIEFARDFLPVKNKFELDAYEEIENKYNEFMERLLQLRSEIERLDKQDKVKAFAKDHFPISLQRKNEVFLFTYTYISTLLIDYVSTNNSQYLEKKSLRRPNPMVNRWQL